MKTTLCTLYNSLYLDKGLVLFDSLKKCSKSFELYVLCMDEKCYEIIHSINDSRMKPIKLSAVEDEAMLEAKSNRTFAEYCWTCSSRLIQYILDYYHPECCTYIDADMYFYNDPQYLIDEMLDSGKSVLIVPHRFVERNLHIANKVGTFCVEFNSFRNNDKARIILDRWHEKCIECCSSLNDGIHWGDQKYLDEWPEMYPDDVYVCNHDGAGVAPWNIDLYTNYEKNEGSVFNKVTGERIRLFFCHFESISYLSKNRVRTGVIDGLSTIDYSFVKDLYIDYLRLIDEKKLFIESRYGISLIIKHHPSFSLREKIKRRIKGNPVTEYLLKIMGVEYFREYELFIW